MSKRPKLEKVITQEQKKEIEAWLKSNPSTPGEREQVGLVINSLNKTQLRKYRKFWKNVASIDPEVEVRLYGGKFFVVLSGNFYEDKQALKEFRSMLHRNVYRLSDRAKRRMEDVHVSGKKEEDIKAVGEVLLGFKLAENQRKPIADFLNKTAVLQAKKSLKVRKRSHDWLKFQTKRRDRILKILRLRPGELARLNDPKTREEDRTRLMQIATQRGQGGTRRAKWENQGPSSLPGLVENEDHNEFDPVAEYASGFIPSILKGIPWTVGGDRRFHFTIPPLDRLRKTKVFHSLAFEAEKSKKLQIMRSWELATLPKLEDLLRRQSETNWKGTLESSEDEIIELASYMIKTYVSRLDKKKFSELQGSENLKTLMKGAGADFWDQIRTDIPHGNRLAQGLFEEDIAGLGTVFRGIFGSYFIDYVRLLAASFQSAEIDENDIRSTLESMVLAAEETIQEKIDLYSANMDDPLLRADSKDARETTKEP